MEYGWARRSPFARPILDGPRRYDYPVYLFLKLYRFADPTHPSPSNMRTEEIEYQFSEMSHDLEPLDFDTSICYRSLDLPYVHLGFVLQASNESALDSPYVDRRVLERLGRTALVNALQISSKRVSLFELDHIRADHSVYVLFTLLGSTPFSSHGEVSIATAQQHLKTTIDAGQLTFNMTLLDNERSSIVFRGKANSLKISKQFMSIHASSVYANISNCSTTVSNCPVANVNQSQTESSRIRREKYTRTAQVSSILGGLVLGIVLGVVALTLVTFLTKRSTSMTSSSIVPGGLNNISFGTKKPASSYSMQNLQETISGSDN